MDVCLVRVSGSLTAYLHRWPMQHILLVLAIHALIVIYIFDLLLDPVIVYIVFVALLEYI